MQHRMTEINIVGHESKKMSDDDPESQERFPTCVSSMQKSNGAANGSGYKVKRVLYHHGYNINPKRGKNWDYRTGGDFAGYNHREKMNRQRAIAVACLGFFLVFLILWLVARNRSSML